MNNSFVNSLAQLIHAGLFSNNKSATSETNFLKSSDLATKSVSELTSKITASLPLATTYVKPSAAIRVAF